MSEYTIRVVTTPSPTVVVQADPSFSTKQAVEAAAAAEADRIQTGLDRTATSADATATAADRAQTGLDAAATAADRVQTGEDVAESTAVLASSLKIANNLSDVASAPAALVNLGVTATAAELNLLDGDRFAIQPIGVPFPVWDHITGIDAPSNAGSAKFIRLTAGLTGSGQYNNGLLGSESVSGSAPLVQATATILAGPATDEIVRLINTEEAFLRARETSGALQFDQMQRIVGSMQVRVARFGGTQTGAISDGGSWGNEGATVGNQVQPQFNFNSASSPDARASSTTSGETRSKNVSATYYMRIL